MIVHKLGTALQVGEAKFLPYNSAERFPILLGGSHNYFRRKLRAGIGLAPTQRLKIVADVLLVETILGPTGLVRFGVPEAEIGRAHV